MNSVNNETSVLSGVILDLFPPLVRTSLLNDASFREKYGLKTEAMVEIASMGIRIPRSEFYSAIRQVIGGQPVIELKDSQDQAFKLYNDADKDHVPAIFLLFKDQRLALPDFSIFSEDLTFRTNSLERSALETNLPHETKQQWRDILESRPLDDDEVDSFFDDLRDTPTNRERIIRSEIEAGKSSISSLVPNSRRYYERLIGSYDGSNSINVFAARQGRELFQELSNNGSSDAFLRSLLLSSHLTLTAEIPVDYLSIDDLHNAFESLIKPCDMLSRLGAIEVGLRILPKRREIEPFLLKLIQLISEDDVDSKASQFRLFSTLFMLVDGELARTRVMADTPPFYRRLASIAHAALIERQLVQCGVNFEHFSEWALSNRGVRYYLQTLVDMRTEPRWEPDLGEASQFKAEFFGRIVIAANSFEVNIGKGELRDLILGEEGLIKRNVYPYPFLPGPLEGAEDTPNVLPPELSREIEDQLNCDSIDSGSFIALVNAARIFRIHADHAELAAQALRLANHTLANLADKSQLFAILNGLATVAAVSRNPSLADEVRVLSRRYRNDPEYSFPINEEVRICLVTSSSRKELPEWTRFVGEWLTELAFSELGGSEAKAFRSQLEILLHSVPELWLSCARADAALEGWLSR